jgi:hypothetical protein
VPANTHLIPCASYLRRLENVHVFRFCAIPQVMAIATLDKCFNNYDVFTGVVKVRKGLAVRMILDSNSLDGVELWFRNFAQRIKGRVDPSDPCASKTIQACDVVLGLTADARPALLRATPAFLPPMAVFALAGAAYARDSKGPSLGKQMVALFNGALDKTQAAVAVTTVAASAFLLAYAFSSFAYKSYPGTKKLKAT